MLNITKHGGCIMTIRLSNVPEWDSQGSHSCLGFGLLLTAVLTFHSKYYFVLIFLWVSMQHCLVLSHSYVWLWNILVIVCSIVINLAGWSSLSFLSGRHVFWRPRPQLASQDKSHTCIMIFKSNEVSYYFISKEKQLFFVIGRI